MRPIEPGEAFSTPPAPVYTDDDFYEVRPPPPRLTRPRPARVGRGRLVTTALAVVCGLWVLALAASQATSAAVALPFLERTVSALGDVPALLQLHEQAIRTAANQPGTGPVPVPGFPVQGVALPRALAQTGTRDDWRAMLLAASAETAYERGPAVFAPANTPADSRAFSTSQWIRIVMAVESSDAHATVSLVAWALGLATLAMAVLVLVVVDGIRRYVAIGLGLIGGALLAAVIGLGGLLVAMLFGLGSGSDFVAEVGVLIRTIAWAPVQDAARLGIAGIAIAVPAAALAAWRARHDDLDDGYDEYVDAR